jgi:hypothetical protein
LLVASQFYSFVKVLGLLHSENVPSQSLPFIGKFLELFMIELEHSRSNLLHCFEV